MQRADAFTDLADFAPKTSGTAVDLNQINQIANDHGFPSRPVVPAPATTTPKRQRRNLTGRNQQLAMKVTAETLERFYSLADELSVPLGELMERLLDAHEKSFTRASK